MFVLSSRFGALAGKYGPRWFMAAGPAIAAGGFLLLIDLRADSSYLTHVLPTAIIFGIGLSATVAPLTAAILGSISSQQAGIGSAINNAVARIAGLIAIAGIGLIIGDSITEASFHRSVVATVAIMLLSSLISAVGITNSVAVHSET